MKIRRINFIIEFMLNQNSHSGSTNQEASCGPWASSVDLPALKHDQINSEGVLSTFSTVLNAYASNRRLNIGPYKFKANPIAKRPVSYNCISYYVVQEHQEDSFKDLFYRVHNPFSLDYISV
jgi:hypothetical protein